MLKWICAAALIVSAPAVSQAASFTLGDAAKVSIDIPDSWNPKPYEGGVEAQSEAGTYVDLQAVAASDVGAAVKDSIQSIAKQGLTIDPASQKQQEGLTINGMTCAAFQFDGTFEDKPNSVLMFFCAPDGNTMAVLTSWFDTESQQADDKDYSAILDSLKPAK